MMNDGIVSCIISFYKENTMWFTTVKNWLKEITEIGILLVAVGIVLEVVFGKAVPFLGANVVGNIIGIVKALGNEGLVGLMSLGVIAWLINHKAC